MLRAQSRKQLHWRIHLATTAITTCRLYSLLWRSAILRTAWLLVLTERLSKSLSKLSDYIWHRHTYSCAAGVINLRTAIITIPFIVSLSDCRACHCSMRASWLFNNMAAAWLADLQRHSAGHTFSAAVRWSRRTGFNYICCGRSQQPGPDPVWRPEPIKK